MGLDSALVDRARVVSQQATSVRVRGMTQLAQVEGAWFAALLTLPEAGAQPDASQGRRRVVRVPTLICDVIDEENNPVVVNASDRVEVESDRFGRTVWEATADPQPLATLHETLGYQLTVRQITDHEFTPV